MSYNDGTDDELDFAGEEEIGDNEAQVIITLQRTEDGVEGMVDAIEGMDFDPGDEETSPGNDLLRLSAEMLLVAAGYDENEVQNFLDTAPRGPVQMLDTDS
ncbi:MAG: hypothetical protein M3P51_04125 [Chloroflexota bacterium]|nr:hypothetical protein [Chloroflexota bacterium]